MVELYQIVANFILEPVTITISRGAIIVFGCWSLLGIFVVIEEIYTRFKK